MRCGTVRVPRDYAHPDGPSFALSVVVIDSEQKPAFPAPVVYINGGPGEPITVYAAAQAKTPYASGRDLVLIDQCGTGGSEPRICPTMDRKLLDATLLLGARVALHESRSIGEIIGRNAQWIEFPEVGHNVRAFSPCARRIVADFIAQPRGARDDGCALHPLPLQFSKTPRQQ